MSGRRAKILRRELIALLGRGPKPNEWRNYKKHGTWETIALVEKTSIASSGSQEIFPMPPLKSASNVPRRLYTENPREESIINSILGTISATLSSPLAKLRRYLRRFTGGSQ